MKEKISTVSEKFLEYIDVALSVELNITSPIGSLKEQELKDYISHLTKPLLITEGKTDVQLIETAWKKLYPDESMFFQCNASGIGFEKKNRTGNADNVKRSIEYWSTIAGRPIIGLDREGNEKFKGLNENIFEKYDIKKDILKKINF